MGSLGRVLLQAGGFGQPGEVVLDHPQQPQFFPRLQWPTISDAEDSLDQVALNMNINWRNNNHIEELHREIRDIYPRLPLMAPYDAGQASYDETNWYTHLATAHNLFHRTLQTGRNLNTQEMSAMIRIVTYGIFYSTTQFMPWHVNGVPMTPASRTKANTFEQTWSPTWCIDIKAGNHGEDIETRGDDWIKKRVWKRRWIVVPIVYGGCQWGITIFDRYQGQLYIFDCGDEELKKERIQSAIHLWVQFLNRLGQPYSFNYFVPKVTKQLEIKDSGILCVIWLMDMLRNQTGEQMNSHGEDIELENIEICDEPEHLIGWDEHNSYSSSLHMRDWVPDGCFAPKSMLMAVRRILRVLLANELGLRTHEVMQKEYINQPGFEPNRLPSALTLIRNYVEEINFRDGQMPKERYLTARGGPQFALPMRRAVRPYDRHANRRHLIHRAENTCRIPIRPAELSRRESHPFLWPDSFKFHPGYPAKNPEPDVDLAVTYIEDVPRRDSNTSRNFNVILENTRVPEVYKNLLQKIRIVVNEMHVRRASPGEDGLFIVFTLGVGIGEGQRKMVDVSMPLPRIPGDEEITTPSTERLGSD